ncbi:uncharacterized protein LOC143858733 [Tasmannia lanceolata]|uniref:uncharacterized protein LOC143858733 n=1 Tax=Tasmannia lanceolata TaxID=3420 RepID=UPI00406317DB
MEKPILFVFFFVCSLSFFTFFFISLYKKRKREQDKSTQNSLSLFNCSINKTQQNHPLFVEILTSNHSPKWDSISPNFNVSLPLISDVGEKDNSSRPDGSELDTDAGDAAGDDCERSADSMGKKKKKRGKKKRQNLGGRDDEGCGDNQAEMAALAAKQGFDCLYPFTSSSSATQRKIKQHYDQIIKSNDAKALTVAQVGQFANCLIEAKHELQHKSEIIQRKFTITKALLVKADRSSFDRLCQQIHKLEVEQKRLEEDALVYNRLQEQLKLSPAFNKMLEISMELEANSGQLVEDPDAEFSDISFEELLAQEKKDSFWHRNGKLRSCTT